MNKKQYKKVFDAAVKAGAVVFCDWGIENPATPRWKDCQCPLGAFYRASGGRASFDMLGVNVAEKLGVTSECVNAFTLGFDQAAAGSPPWAVVIYDIAQERRWHEAGRRMFAELDALGIVRKP